MEIIFYILIFVTVAVLPRFGRRMLITRRVDHLTREERLKYPWHVGCLLYNVKDSLHSFYDYCIDFTDKINELVKTRTLDLKYETLVRETSDLAVQTCTKASKDFQEAADHLFRTGFMLKVFGYNRTVSKILDIDSIYSCKQILGDTLKTIQA